MSRRALAPPQELNGTIRRFEPAYWYINFPIPVTGALITTGPNSMRLLGSLHTNKDNVALVWESKDTKDHPLFAYEFSRNYRDCILSFDYAITGAMRLMDQQDGPTLTATDDLGNQYFVRLFNYATGGSTGSSGTIVLDFNQVKGGEFEDVDIPWERIEEMFIFWIPDHYGAGRALTTSSVSDGATSVTITVPNGVPISAGDTIRVKGATNGDLTVTSNTTGTTQTVTFTPGLDVPGGAPIPSGTPVSVDTAEAHPIPFASPARVEFEVNLTNISVTGGNHLLGINTTGLAPHYIRMTDGYDNAYPFAPERIVNQMMKLGYREWYNIYIGISHHHHLDWNPTTEKYEIDLTPGFQLAPAAQAFFEDLYSRLHDEGFKIISSVSFEILDQLCPSAWAQRDATGQQALTGWTPSSTLVSPSSAPAMAYLRDTFLALADIANDLTAPVYFQIGEPWYWDGSFSGGVRRPFIYDSNMVAEYQALPFPLAGITTGFTGGTTVAPNTNFSPGAATTDYFWFRATLDIAPTDTGIIFEVGGSTTGIMIYAHAGRIYVQAGNGTAFGPASNRFEISWAIQGSGSRLLEVIIDRPLGLALSIDGKVVAYQLGSITGQIAQNNSGRFSGGSGTVCVNRGGYTTASNYSGAMVTSLVRINNKQWASPTVPTPYIDDVADGVGTSGPYLDWCRAKLGNAGLYLRDQVKAAYPSSTSLILIFTPQFLGTSDPILRRINLPVDEWKAPAFDILQVEDYDKVVEGNYDFITDQTIRAATDLLGYDLADTQYFVGFNLFPQTTWIWYNIDRALWHTRDVEFAETFIWSREQVLRDGWVYSREAHKFFSELTTLAACWKIVRTDGTILRFTTHDKAIVYAGETYSPANSYLPGDIELATDGSSNQMEVWGITSDDITESDLLLGLFEHAFVEIFLVDYTDLTIPRTVLQVGWIGQVRTQQDSFQADLRGLVTRLQQSIGETVSPDCRWDLGDSQCQVNVAALTVTDTVDSVPGLNAESLSRPASSGSALEDAVVQTLINPNDEFICFSRPEADGHFDFGTLTWTSGDNAGLSMEVIRFSGGYFKLMEGMPFQIQVGDGFEVFPGCDKRPTTCKSKFNNFVNNGGFPHVPGTDDILEFPNSRSG